MSAPPRSTVLIALGALGALVVLALGLQLHATRPMWVLAALVVAGGAIWAAPRIPTRHRAITVALAVLCALATWGQDRGRLEHLGRDGQVDEWGVFHYYLGAKYFDELGYTRLYDQTLAADASRRHPKLGGVKKLRDLRSYRIVPTKELKKRKRGKEWTDERWTEFRRDVSCLLPMTGRKRWGHMLLDRGYNPPPTYTLVVGAINEALPLCGGWSQTTLMLLDWALVLSAFALSRRVFGTTRSLLVLLGFVGWYGNSDRLLGQIWIWDWFAASWAGLSLLRGGRPFAAGLALGYATCVRVFPGVFLLGATVAGAAELWRTRAMPRWLPRLAAGAALMATLLVGGSAARYGVGAWTSWAANMSHHNESHVTGEKRFGLKHALLVDVRDGVHRPKTPADARRIAQDRRPLWLLLTAVICGMALVGMTRSDATQGALLGLAFFFTLIVSSRYYASSMALLFLGLRPRAPPRERWAFAMGWVVIAVLGVATPKSGGHVQSWYLFTNAAWTAWWLVAALWAAWTAGDAEGAAGPRDASD